MSAIQPCSVDVRIGRKYRHIGEEAFESAHYRLDPDEFILADTLERVKVPNTHAMKVDGKSSLGRLGLQVHATAGLIDPGFEGTVTLELKNLTKYPVHLGMGMHIAQLEIHRLDTPADPVYGEATGAHYQGQEGPTPSYLEKEQGF